MDLRAKSTRQALIGSLIVTSALTIAACGGGGGSSVNGGGHCPRFALGYGGGGGGGSGSGGTCPTPAPAASAAPVGLLLTGESPMSTASDGTVLGFFNGTNGSPPSGSGVVHLTASTNVMFVNVEAAGGLPHTASFLGPFSGSYPATFTNTSGVTPSAASASISSPNFSSGNLNPGASSAIYSTGGPGMFIFGCFYHYVANHMRTVIIVG